MLIGLLEPLILNAIQHLVLNGCAFFVRYSMWILLARAERIRLSVRFVSGPLIDAEFGRLWNNEDGFAHGVEGQAVVD